VALQTDPGKARAIARKFLAIYLTLPNYTNNWLRLGFEEADFSNGGSDRLIDAVIAWGDLKTVMNRVNEHHAAGADHVCVQVLTDDARTLPMREYRELASAIRRN
jgi:probable F420-dependent oxidoreductase